MAKSLEILKAISKELKHYWRLYTKYIRWIIAQHEILRFRNSTHLQRERLWNPANEQIVRN